MRSLTRASRCCPERVRLAALSASFDRAGQHEDKFIGRMGMSRNDSSPRETRAVDRTILDRLGERQQLHSRQEVDPHPEVSAGGLEDLLFGHCGPLRMVGNPGLSIL